MSRRGVLGILILLLASGSLLAIWLIQGPDVADRDLSGLEGDVRRGAYVARLSGCIACHTDTKSGGGLLAGGAAIKTPFGSFLPPNITPDPDHGIGAWSLQDFSRAVRNGVSPEGDHYFPAFPFAFYNRLTDQDITDLWAAVRSVPPVADSPPGHDLIFPFNLRAGAAAWQRLFFDNSTLAEPVDKSPAWKRGRYLAEGPSHCGACHTPRNLLGARDSQRRYKGGIGPGNEKIPGITPDQLEKAGWTKADFVYALQSGIMPDGDTFGGSMAELVRNSTRYWKPEDLEALAEFIFDPDY